MYYGNINYLNDSTLLDAFKDCLNFMSTVRNSDVENGKQLKINDNCIAYYQCYMTHKSNETFLESHRLNYDIQFMVNGEEIIEETSIVNLHTQQDYSLDKDIIFYKNPNFVTSSLILRNGDFLIVGPNDAHKPGINIQKSSKVQKIVIKVPVQTNKKH